MVSQMCKEERLLSLCGLFQGDIDQFRHLPLLGHTKGSVWIEFLSPQQVAGLKDRAILSWTVSMRGGGT